MVAGPYYSVETPTPAWARLIAGSDGSIVHQIDARGSGLIGGITPQRLIPHGETPSILSSAMVKSDATSTANGFEGIGHSLQGFVRGPTGSPVKVYDNNILTNGDPAQWINEIYPEKRRVTFIDQMPENISPEWMKSVWFTKTITGQTEFSNLEFRDHYSRRYKTDIGTATYNEGSFDLQTNTNFLLGRSVIAQNHYLDTQVLNIAKGQGVGLEIESFIDLARITTMVGTRLPITLGIALKMTRELDGGIEWWSTSIGSAPDSYDLTNELVGRSETFVAQSAYRQIETVLWITAQNINTSDIGFITVEHSGIKVNVNLNDAVESGV